MTEHRHPVSITPSGFFGQGPEMIGGIEPFLTEDEINFLSNFIKSNDKWDVTETHYNDEGTIIYESSYWANRVATMPTLMAADPKVVDTLHGIIARLKPEVDKFFKVDAMPTSPALVRWLPGQLQMPHADKELHEGDNAGKPNDFPWYDLATVVYLNDDYVGGELYFPNQDIQFKPKRGAVYFFPGDMNYVHGVTVLESGIRYTCPFFWTITKHLEA